MVYCHVEALETHSFNRRGVNQLNTSLFDALLVELRLGKYGYPRKNNLDRLR